MFIEVVKAKHVKDYKIELLFNDGEKGIIDLKNDDAIIDMRKIDYGNFEHKKWLGKVSHWAWSQGYSVETMALKDAEGR